MRHNGTLENFPSRGPFYIHAKAPREQLLKKNHKHGSQTKDFNKNKYTSQNTGLTQDIISLTCPKVNSVCFDEPYDHIHHMENTHEDTHLIGTQEQDM